MSEPTMPVAGSGEPRAAAGIPGSPLLELQQVGIQFGGVTALRDLSFSVAEGALHAVVGPNGAGKTTAFNCVTRSQRPDSGDVLFRGKSLLRTSPSKLSRLGIMRTFQHPQLCSNLTVLENVLLGYHGRLEVGWASWFVRSPASRREERRATAEALELLTMLELGSVVHHEADRLPYAALKRVELARALIGQPVLLLLDEPAAGLTTEDVDQFGDVLQRLNQELSITIMLIEHNLSLVGRLADKVTVLVDGHVVAEGSLAEVKELETVREAFLGRVRA